MNCIPNPRFTNAPKTWYASRRGYNAACTMARLLPLFFVYTLGSWQIMAMKHPRGTIFAGEPDRQSWTLP